jgi:hypothetical protein
MYAVTIARHTGEKQFKFELKTIKISIKIYPQRGRAGSVLHTTAHNEITRRVHSCIAAQHFHQHKTFPGNKLHF